MTGGALNKIKAIRQKKYYTDQLHKKLFDCNVGIRPYWRTLHNIINKKQAMNIPHVDPVELCACYKF